MTGILLLTFSILFLPNTSAVSHICTAYERHFVQGHPELTDDGSVIGAVQALVPSTWTAVTCTIAAACSGGVCTATITNAALDPNLPNLEVIACIAAVDGYGTHSVCVNADNFIPTDPNNLSLRGIVSPPVANASDQ